LPDGDGARNARATRPLVTGELTHLRTDRRVVIALLNHPAVDVIFVGVDQRSLSDRPLDQV
jgi:hypothetical protein